MRRDGEYTVYECLLPWQLIGLGDPKPGRVIGLYRAVYDADGPGEIAATGSA